jgi:hypothetical protein
MAPQGVARLVHLAGAVRPDRGTLIGVDNPDHASILDLAPSTVHRVLVRHQMPRLSWLDRPTGQVIRRYEGARPGELVHVDVKKIGRLRDGGGWRVHGRDSLDRRRARAATRVGYEYVHAAIDDHTRLA